MEKSPIINNPVELKPDFDILEVNEYIKNFVTKLREKLKKLYSYRIDPSTRVEIQTLQGALDSTTENIYHKIDQQLGTNEGGWYENNKTRERFYIKFYKNPDQARIEYIANAIYKKLGIRAVESTLLDMDGKFAIASKEIPGGGQSSYREEQAKSPDIRSGFLADTYLANWDVVGLVFDNIMKDANGNMYRVDNGGSLNFRAQGGLKDFLPNDIPELKNMLNPDFSAGQVFAGITEEELKSQAEHLVQDLSDGDIEEIVKQSGLDEEKAKILKQALVGRKRFLINKFKIDQRPMERIPIAIEKLKEQLDRLKGLELRPRVGIIADADKVENQEIDIIDASDLGRYEINFKLTDNHWETIIKELKEKMELSAPAEIREGAIYYIRAVASGSEQEITKLDWENQYDNRAQMAEAITIEKDGVIIRVSTERHRRSLSGLVHIEVPHENTDISGQQIGLIINNILEEILQIPGGLSVPTPEAEIEYKKARYAWHHKITLDQVPQDMDSKLIRQEVFPGYFTFCEKDKYKKYEKLSPFATYHSLNSTETLSWIIKAGGLLSTHERYRRGLIFNGSSSLQDLETGGADNVFVRTVTLDGLKTTHSHDATINNERGVIIFNPRILDRTDWYAYPVDEYGKTTPEVFIYRQSPEQLFDDQKNGKFSIENEQMFRCGISLSDILAITFRSEEKMFNARKILRAAGIETINGRPVEEMIVLIKTLKDAIDLSGGKTEQLMTLAKFIQENPDEMKRYE
ncbi:MAG: hypothetical protein UV48_C0001G0031 [Candidatus Azambacteria bacterium GW2011_GWA2_42_9]|uniref:Uncharacterized protein n=2 Tax=Candidatus Azamiibacteriota TaxID=1752741 RepID=A0A0G0Z6Z5_9BACT|nr:MAG: hypothetical protein UV07_C0008G0004 [Candidatus Azambacteria bacterium GW2011_GWB1_42_17]KKS76159.1 MAG: hypothetical protein UV48_C0001G0031 [Candidatus Azambacteria bacterium GW2011_GWA2_42_9]KKS88209.1 MAG: hypothetical protein UV62_C0011G0005 [Parcubacteria group bacterium GW2011_GWC1_43_11]